MYKPKGRSLAVVIFLSAILFGANVLAQTQVDSLKQLLKTSDGTDKIDVLLRISREVGRSDQVASERYVDEAFELLQPINYPEGEFLALIVKATLIGRSGNHYEAVNLVNRAIELATSENMIRQLAEGQLTLGVLQLRRENYAEAFETVTKSVTNAKKAEHHQVLVNCLINLGVIKEALGELDQAESYFIEALEYFGTEDQAYRAAGIRLNLGRLEQKRLNYGRSVDYFQAAVEGFESVNDRYNLAVTLSNLGSLWLEMGDYDKAMECLNQSHSIREAMEDRKGISRDLLSKAKVFYARNNRNVALSSAKKSLQIAQEIELWTQVRDVYEFLHEDAEKIGNTVDALDYYKKFTIARDTISERTNRNKILELSAKYAVDELRSQNALQKRDAEIDSLKIRQRNLVIIGLILLSLGFIVMQLRTNRKLRISKREHKISQEKTKTLSVELQEQRKKLLEFTNELVNKNLKQDDLLEAEEDHSEKEVVSNDVESIREKLNVDLVNDKDWLAFNLMFDAAYPEFSKHLESTFGELTLHHQRLAALIKIQLSNKEIAAIFNISRNSVVRAKYRLREKTGFESNKEMQSFLKNL